MQHIAGVANAWKRTTTSSCGTYTFMIDLDNGCCVCIHLPTLTRIPYYFSGASWTDLCIEAIHSVSATHIVVIGQVEATRSFHVIFTEVDHQRQLIAAKYTLNTNLIYRIGDMQPGCYVSSFFHGTKIYLIKHITDPINKNSTDFIEIFRCSVENGKLTEKTNFKIKSPEGTWSLPFVINDDFLLLDTMSGCTRAHVTVLSKTKKTKIVSCKGEHGRLPRGMLANVISIHDQKAWMTTCEMKAIGQPVALWSLDLQNWIWKEHPLIFPFGLHKPVKLRSMDIIPNGTVFMHGNCLETPCPVGGHIYSFRIDQLQQIGSGPQFNMNMGGPAMSFQSTGSFSGCIPSAPPIDMEQDEDYAYGTIKRGPTEQPQSPSQEPIRFRQPSSKAPLPPQVPAHRNALKDQYLVLKEMGFSEPSLYRLIEKHEFKPFDSIDDMITALDAMTVAEEREEVYGNFVPPPKNISQTAPWLVSDSESTLKPSPVTLCASTKRLSADVPETKCIICWDAPSSVLILPCKHFSFCGTCAKEITTTCPKCKGKVASKIENIFVG